MKGLNPIRKPVMDEGEELAVQSIFATIQGEGPNAGLPAVFIRLGGCNLACDFCDTEFESFKAMALDALLDEVETRAAASIKLVVITGGEPLRQNIAPLCKTLLKKDFAVQVETNGTIYRDLPDDVQIVCSPKVTNGEYHPIRPDLAARIDAYKFIVSAHHPDYRDVPVLKGEVPVYVQPMDEQDEQQNAANAKHATHIAMRHNYRLSLQLHKILGIQ